MVQGLTSGDAGNYRCLAKNEYSEAYNEKAIFVEGELLRSYLIRFIYNYDLFFPEIIRCVSAFKLYRQSFLCQLSTNRASFIL